MLAKPSAYSSAGSAAVNATSNLLVLKRDRFFTNYTNRDGRLFMRLENYYCVLVPLLLDNLDCSLHLSGRSSHRTAHSLEGLLTMA